VRCWFQAFAFKCNLYRYDAELDALQEELKKKRGYLAAQARKVRVSGVSGEGTGRGTAVRLVFNKTEIDEAAAALRAAKATLRRAQRREYEADAGGGGDGDEDGEEGEEEGDEEGADDPNAAGESKRKRKKSSAFSEESAALLQSIRARVYTILAISGGGGVRDEEEDLKKKRGYVAAQAREVSVSGLSGIGKGRGTAVRLVYNKTEIDEAALKKKKKEEDRAAARSKSTTDYLRAAMVRHGYLDAAAAQAVSNVDALTLVAQLRKSERRKGEDDAAKAAQRRNAIIQFLRERAAERAAERAERPWAKEYPRARLGREEARAVVRHRSNGVLEGEEDGEKQSSSSLRGVSRPHKQQQEQKQQQKDDGGDAGKTWDAVKKWGMGAAGTGDAVKMWDDVMRDERSAQRKERRERREGPRKSWVTYVPSVSCTLSSAFCFQKRDLRFFPSFSRQNLISERTALSGRARTMRGYRSTWWDCRRRRKPRLCGSR
jgi:hypothetical protein